MKLLRTLIVIVFAGIQSQLFAQQNDSILSVITSRIGSLDSTVEKIRNTVEVIKESISDGASPVDSAELSIKNIRMNYAVPDAPAFKALGIQPDQVMRPSTSKELSVIAGNQVLQGVIPAALALEFSPYLTLAGESVTLKKYQDSWLTRILYNAHLSVATQRSDASGDTTKIAGGIRFTIIDKSDLRTDAEYVARLYEKNDSILSIESGIRDHFRGPLPDFKRLSKEKQDSINNLADDSIKTAVKALEDSITAYRENAIKRNWNRPIVELGFAGTGYSPDSTSVKGIAGTSVMGWLVAAGNLYDWGQFVIGANGAYTIYKEEKKDIWSGSVGARLYAGNNAAKTFIGVDAKAETTMLPQYLAQLGGELLVYKMFWVDVAAGVKSITNGRYSVTSNFNIRLGTP